MKQLTATAAAITLGLSQASMGALLYDNLGPGDEFSYSAHYMCGGDIMQAGYTCYNAMRFDLAPGTYGDISVVLPLAKALYSPGADFDYQVKIYTPDGVPSNPDWYPGEVTPGTCLATITANTSDLGILGVDMIDPTTFTFDSLELTGDSQYWIGIETGVDPTGGVAWMLNATDTYGWNAWRVWNQDAGDPVPDLWELRNDDIGWGPNAGMRILGNLVPAPSSLALFGVVGLARCLRRRN